MPHVPKKNTLLVGGEGEDPVEVQPRAVMLRPVCPKGEMEVIAHMLHGMLTARRFAVLEASKGGAQVSSEELQQMILADARASLEQCINTTFGTVNWVPSAERFENKAVVLHLPIGGRGKFILVGFDVDENKAFDDTNVHGTASSVSVYWGRQALPRMTAYSS